MPVITLQMLGRTGNQIMQYLFARAYAEKHGFDFQCDPWIGQRIFQIDDKPITVRDLPRRSELDYVDGEGDIEFRGYAQNQRAMLYTKKQAMEWLKFLPHIETSLAPIKRTFDVLAHRRVGDYFGAGFCVVSEKSYIDAGHEHGLPDKPHFITEESPTVVDQNTLFDGDLKFVPDFYRLCHAPVLLRGNSTFSWVAGLLNTGFVFSPVIDGLEGGKEHDNVKFVEGNWPRLANHSFCSDLHLPS